MSTTRPASLEPLLSECPNCHVRALFSDADGEPAGCARCGYNTDEPRACGCTGNAECGECCELGTCGCCQADGVQVRILSANDGECERCAERSSAYERWVDRQIDERRDA